MILSDIRRYLEQRGQASLADMAVHFDIQPDALRGMLEVWMRKGRVHKRVANAACGSSCHQCQATATEVYVWSGSRLDSSAELPATCSQV